MIRNFDAETGDLVTSGAQFLNGREATASAIRARLKMFFGEYFLDIADGTPWFQSILGKAPQEIAEAALKQRIATTPGVVKVTQFSFNSDAQARRIDIDASVLDVNNEIVKIILSEDVL